LPQSVQHDRVDSVAFRDGQRDGGLLLRHGRALQLGDGPARFAREHQVQAGEVGAIARDQLQLKLAVPVGDAGVVPRRERKDAYLLIAMGQLDRALADLRVVGALGIRHARVGALAGVQVPGDEVRVRVRERRLVIAREQGVERCQPARVVLAGAVLGQRLPQLADHVAAPALLQIAEEQRAAVAEPVDRPGRFLPQRALRPLEVAVDQRLEVEQARVIRLRRPDRRTLADHRARARAVSVLHRVKQLVAREHAGRDLERWIGPAGEVVLLQHVAAAPLRRVGQAILAAIRAVRAVGEVEQVHVEAAVAAVTAGGRVVGQRLAHAQLVAEERQHRVVLGRDALDVVGRAAVVHVGERDGMLARAREVHAEEAGGRVDVFDRVAFGVGRRRGSSRGLIGAQLGRHGRDAPRVGRRLAGREPEQRGGRCARQSRNAH